MSDSEPVSRPEGERPTDLLVLLPTYNEAATLPPIVNSLFELPLERAQLRIMVIDDASPDGTGAIADDLAERYANRILVLHRRAKTGLGRAYIEGFARAIELKPDLIGHMDADLSHDPRVIPEMIRAVEDADLVIGSRYVAGGSVDPDWSWHRKALSWSANRLVIPAILRLPVRDATSGYRLWKREALQKVDPQARVKSVGYGFLTEMAYLATRLGCRATEVPIHFRERTAGKSKMTLSVQLAAIREIFAIRRRYRHMR
jgi:dolichol-phosphate mannosyltransferase